MTAYSFQPMFRPPILAERKRQTIRAERKRHARPGEQVQLYTGMRTLHCALIGRATCTVVAPVTIGVEGSFLVLGEEHLRKSARLDGFAQEDGFDDWAEMRAFWRKHHPQTPVFSGVLVRWEGIVA